MENSVDRRVDTILQALGPGGKFTVLQLIMISLGMFTSCAHLLSNVFIGFPAPHRCFRPENESSILSDFKDYENISIVYNKCDITFSTNTTIIKKTGCVHGMHYYLAAERSFVSEFNLVCNSASLAQLSQTLFVLGQALGAIVFTLMADRLGRKCVTIASNLGILASGVILAFAPNYTAFAILKFLIGFFQQGVITSFCTFLIEIVITRDRRLLIVLGGTIVPLTYMILDLLAVALRHHSWRKLELALSLPSLAAFIQWWYLEESLRWLIANGRSKAAVAYIRRAAKCNGKDFEKIKEALQLGSSLVNETQDDYVEDIQKCVKSSEDFGALGKKPAAKLSILDVFKVKRLALTTIVMCFTWIVGALGYFAIYLTATRLSGNPYLNFFLISLMEIPSNMFFFFTFNRIGRRWPISIAFLLLSAGLIGNSIFQSLEQNSATRTVSLVTYCIGMFGASGAFGGLFLYTPEMYPTNVRNQALGMCSFVCRFGAMIAPFIGLLSEKVSWGPGVLMGCLAFMAALLLLVLTDTKNKELAQTMEELLVWFQDNKTNKTFPQNETNGSIEASNSL